MKIIMITTMTPTSENIRGTSALPYHLLAGRDKDVSVEIYTFNNNGVSDDKMQQVERELNVIIHTLALPKWFRLIFKYHLLFVRLFLKYPIHHYIKTPSQVVKEIVSENPDLIWVYGAEWSRVTRQFDGYRLIHTLPDSEALYYYRMLGQRFVVHDWKKFWRCSLMYPKFLALERDFPTDATIHYHLVGQEDVAFLGQMNPEIQAHFLRHPHYAVANPAKEIRFHQPKIKLVVAGQYNLYMKQTADEVLEYILCTMDDNESTYLSEMYSITFLGKGWERHVRTLQAIGFEVEHIGFAPNYLEEIIKHDIQVTPISIGTGTKGKVLDALANGLLVLGTPYAMENIAVEHGTSCVVWSAPEQLVETLLEIPGNIEYYEQMAEAGRKAVLDQHNPSRIAKQLFSLPID